MKTTLDEYLGRMGLDSPITDYMIDKLKLPHGQTLRQEKQMQKELKQSVDEYHKRRNAAIDEYNEKVKSGEIIEKSKIELMIEKANGHPDNESTQAARRRCEKKGINWRENKKAE